MKTKNNIIQFFLSRTWFPIAIGIVPRIFFILFLFSLSNCHSAYKGLQVTHASPDCVQKFRPQFKTTWYKATVDVIGKHISGLLLIKAMPDSSKRVVFTNEVGVTFFDFGFASDGSFKVYQIIEQMDKKVVITLLRKDFELIMMGRLKNAKLTSFTQNEEIFYALPGKKETDYFITDKECGSLLRIEKASKRTKKIEVKLWGAQQQPPDSVHLKHFTFDMQIGLNKIQR
jgi:hypothetical protein